MLTNQPGAQRVDALRALDAATVRTSVDLVTSATGTDLARPTPCAGWTLADLLAHMSAQHYGFAAASRRDGDPARWQVHPSADPVAGYATAAAHVLSAFAEDGVVTRVFPLPEFGPGATFPAERAIGFHLVDYVVHSWDVARTLGRAVEFPPPVLDAALVVAEAVPGGEARLRPGAAFAPAVGESGGSTLDRIVALLGRRPSWPA